MGIDQLIQKADDIRYLRWKHLADVLDIHAELVEKFRKVSGLNRPSLASKYLDFHKPNAFFIYDTRASAGVRALLNGIDRQKELAQFSAKRPGTPYPAFCAKVMIYRDREMPGSSPRAVNWRLWSWGRAT